LAQACDLPIAALALGEPASTKASP
jgi:hypothetical protein